MERMIKYLILTAALTMGVCGASDDEIKGVLQGVDAKNNSVDVKVGGAVLKIAIVPETEVEFEHCRDKNGRKMRDGYGMDARLEGFIGERVEVELFSYLSEYERLVAKEIEVECK